MNKLAVFALIAAFACVATANYQDDSDDEYTELSLNPSDEEEVAGLAPDYQVFGDYCVQARDETLAYFKQTTNQAASKIFTIFFSSITDVGTELLEVQKDAVEKGVQLIKETPIVEPKSTQKEDVEEAIEENAERVSLIKTISQSVRIVIGSVLEAVSAQVSQRIALLKAQFTGENLRDAIEMACSSLSNDLAKRLNNKLKPYRDEVVKAMSKNPEKRALAEVMSKLRSENVGCLTTKRVTNIGRFCNVLQCAGPAIYPMLGI